MPDTVEPDRPSWVANRVRLSGSSVLYILAVVVAVTVVAGLVASAQQPLGWIVAAAVTALVLSPVVELQARWVPRGLAIVSTILLSVAVVASVGVGTVVEIQDQLAELEETLPEAARQIEDGQGDDGIAAQLGLVSLVEDLVDQMAERVSPDPTIDDAVGTVPAFFVSGVLVIFFLVWGGTMLDGARRQISDPDRRERIADTASSAAAWTQRYVVLVAALGAVVAAAGTGLAWWADATTPLVLGVVIGVGSVIPYVGVIAGGVPLLVVTAAFEPGSTTVAVAVALVVLQALATFVLRMAVEPRSFHAGPAVIVVSAMIGSDVYGIGGALVAVILGLLAMAVIEAWSRLEAEDDPSVQPDGASVEPG
ncbi:MAG: AI-2E family transporter [Acidimicrobiales bacterium]